MKHYSQRNWIIGSIFLFCVSATNSAQAQVAADGTLSTSVTTPDNLNFTISNGTQAGNNLFHSFSEFSIPTGGSALFDHPVEIQNIINRVTGSSVSNIDGLIQANGSANLFLINPNGIIFGHHASLNVGGSFIASTANSLKFNDGNQFSATASQYTPVLTVSVPIGLQFGAAVGSIRNQSQATDRSGKSVGLQVQPGKTLALVGRNVMLEGGHLTAAGGRIELGSVAGSADINLTSTPQGLALSYEGVQNFQDIELSNLALVTTSGEGGGDIQVQGRNVKLSGGSQILATTLGSQSGGNLIVNASNSVEVLGTTTESGLFDEFLQDKVGILVPLQTTLSTTNFSNENTGKNAGNLTINTGKLIIQDGAQVNAETFGSDHGGNLTVNALDSVEVSGTAKLPKDQPFNGFNLPGFDRNFTIEINGSSSLSTATLANGVAGDLTINTGKLIVQNGGLVTVNPFGGGRGGKLTVKALDSIEVIGTSANRVVPSGLVTAAFGIGSAGDLTIKTEKLRIQKGGRISTATLSGGQGGNLSINASKFIEITGPGSGLLTQTQGGGNAGEINIETEKLSVQDGAEVTVSSRGSGNAGNLKVTADSILLDTKGKLSATTESGKEGGNITLEDLDLLIMRRNSEISTSAGGIGNGGNIKIDTQFLVAAPLENSDIRANAFEGLGGKVEINSQGIFGIESRKESPRTSDITATSEQGPQFNGVVEINTLETEPSSGLVNVPVEIVDISGLISQECQAGGRQGLSKFVVTGRGGLPANPRQILSSDPVLADLGTPVQESKTPSTALSTNLTSSSPPERIIEAQGWIITAQGNVILTAQAPTVTPQSSGLPTPSCRV